MAPFLIFLATMFLTLPPSSSSLASNSYNFPASAISAAPALSPPSLSSSSSPPPPLPPPSLSSPPPPPPPPTSSPDISPLFPNTPGGPQLSPAESSLPIIPSSPSPPKPDDDDAMAAPGPGIAVAPSRLLPASSSLRLVNGGGCVWFDAAFWLVLLVWL